MQRGENAKGSQALGIKEMEAFGGLQRTHDVRNRSERALDATVTIA